MHATAKLAVCTAWLGFAACGEPTPTDLVDLDDRNEGIIAFLLRPQGSRWRNIMVMNAKGSDTRTVVDGSQQEWWLPPPYLTPDGRIVWQNRIGPWVMDVDGTGKQAVGAWGEWSPDGALIATGGSDGIIITRVNGFDSWKLVDRQEHANWYHRPTWSPDGSRLAFFIEHSLPGCISCWVPELWIASLDRSTVTNLGVPEVEVYPFTPKWAPDSDELLFAAQGDVWILRLEGMEYINVTASSGLEVHPTWSPSGAQIAFSTRDALYVIDRDGSNRRRLTDGVGEYEYPSWSR